MKKKTIEQLELEVMGEFSKVDWEEPESLEKEVPPKMSEIRCLIYYRKCKQCLSMFVSKSPNTQYCGDKCKNKASYWRNIDYYEDLRKKNRVEISKKCSVCNTSYTANREDSVVCSDGCREVYNREYQLRGRNCRTCGKFYKGGKSIYCSKDCKPKKKIVEKFCKFCDKKLQDLRKSYCDNKCKKATKRAKKLPKKVYERVCPTCESTFKTTTKQKKYCKPGHLPCGKESRRLRKRTKRNAKLPIESWGDIAKFIENRPEGMELDHIVPLCHPDVCGLHNTWNFQWLEREDNSKKSNQFDGTSENNSWKK